MKGLIKSLLIALLIVSGILSACDLAGYISSGPVGRALWREIRFKSCSEVDFRKIVPFPWDEMYVYGPYFSWNEICVKQFNIPADQCPTFIHGKSIDGINKGTMLLVFRNKGQIVHIEPHRRFNGDFSYAARPVTPDRARFKAEKDGRALNGQAWIRLRLVNREAGSTEPSR